MDAQELNVSIRDAKLSTKRLITCSRCRRRSNACEGPLIFTGLIYRKGYSGQRVFGPLGNGFPLVLGQYRKQAHPVSMFASGMSQQTNFPPRRVR